jgi:hypothetical protein
VSAGQVVGFADEMRLGLIGQTRRVWAPVGAKVVQPLQYERRWCYLVLVVDGRGGRVWWDWTLTMTAPALGTVVAKWQDAGLDAVVWDGAPAHQTLAAQPQPVVLVRQPPHSPELNPAERLIQELRRHIEGKVYPTLSDKYAAAHRFLEELDADPDRVRSLVGYDWITDELATLPVRNAA